MWLSHTTFHKTKTLHSDLKKGFGWQVENNQEPLKEVLLPSAQALIQQKQIKQPATTVAPLHYNGIPPTDTSNSMGTDSCIQF